MATSVYHGSFESALKRRTNRFQKYKANTYERDNSQNNINMKINSDQLISCNIKNATIKRPQRDLVVA